MNVKSKMRLYTNGKQTRITEIYGGGARCKGRRIFSKEMAKTGIKKGAKTDFPNGGDHDFADAVLRQLLE